MKITNVNFSGFDCIISTTPRGSIVITNPSQDFWIYLETDNAEVSMGLKFFELDGRFFEANLPSGRGFRVDHRGLIIERLNTNIGDRLIELGKTLLEELFTSRTRRQ